MSLAGCLLAIGDRRRSLSASSNTLSDRHCLHACVSQTLGTLFPQVRAHLHIRLAITKIRHSQLQSSRETGRLDLRDIIKTGSQIPSQI